MKNREEIRALLDELDLVVADDLESDMLDFKQDVNNQKERVNLIVDSVVCFANSKGGTLVLGIRDKLRSPSRAEAVVGVSNNIDVSKLKEQIFNKTDPHITPQVEFLDVPEGRLLLIHVMPGSNPPYSTSAGQQTRRVGKNCLPLTGSMIRDLSRRSEVSDFSARVIEHVSVLELVSHAEMERLRAFAKENRANPDLVEQSDIELLKSLRLVQEGKLTFAGLLLVGKREVIQKYIPSHEWQYAKMRTDTDIDIQAKGTDTILGALEKLETFTIAFNPIATVEQGFQHLEFRVYPVIALREALLNAFVHRDYLIPGQTNIRMYPNKLEIENLGGFMEDITPENILHHPPVPRNQLLADALVGLGLVNRQNLGVKRIFKSLLVEGKEPPIYSATAKSVRLTFYAHQLDTNFLQLISWLNRQSQNAQEIVTLEMLLILHYLKRHREADSQALAVVCQLEPYAAREVLSQLEHLGSIEHGGFGKSTYYRLTRVAMDQLGKSLGYDRDKRLDREAIKTRVLSILHDRQLSNKEIREISQMKRQNVVELMNDLRAEGLVDVTGLGRSAKWFLTVKE